MTAMQTCAPAAAKNHRSAASSRQRVGPSPVTPHAQDGQAADKCDPYGVESSDGEIVHADA